LKYLHAIRKRFFKKLPFGSDQEKNPPKLGSCFYGFFGKKWNLLLSFSNRCRSCVYFLLNSLGGATDKVPFEKARIDFKNQESRALFFLKAYSMPLRRLF